MPGLRIIKRCEFKIKIILNVLCKIRAIFRSSFCLFTSKFGRIITICLCFGICVLLRLPTAMALTIEEFPECDFFRSLAVSYKPWAKQSQWFQWYDFNLVSLGQILVPFIILVLLNSIIVIRLSAIDRLNKVHFDFTCNKM